MKTLLRSCFLASPSDNEEMFQRNYLHMLQAGLGFELPEDDLIWTFIKDFFTAHTHVPTLNTIRTHFEFLKETGAVNRLELVAGDTPLTRGDFIRHLEQKAEDRRARIVVESAKTMTKIVETGFEIRDGRNKRFLKGAVDAARWFQEKSHDIVAPTLGSKLSGDIIADTAGFRDQYERVEADPDYGVGAMSGLKQMDIALRGLRKGELWIHAGFTGSMKSSLALSWAYTQAIHFANSVFYASLEMPYIQCMNIIYAMHTYHEKFRQARISMGIQQPSKHQTDGNVIHYDRGLEYEKVKLGALNAKERKFLFDIVIPDLDNTDECGGIHLEVADPDKSDYTIIDLRTKAEITYSKTPFSMMVVDHLGLMSPRKWMKSTTENLNEVVRDAKKLAMGFNRGMGMGVLSLFQISREGWKAAAKNEGRYNLTALSYANECERSADIVTSSWLDDDLKRQGRFYVQCLKSRDTGGFERFPVRVEFHCRRLLTDESNIEMNEDAQKKQAEDIANELDTIMDAA